MVSQCGQDTGQSVYATCQQAHFLQGFAGDEQLGEALTGCDLVIIPAGMPRKPGMSRDDLFKVNAGIIQVLISAGSYFYNFATSGPEYLAVHCQFMPTHHRSAVKLGPHHFVRLGVMLDGFSNLPRLGSLDRNSIVWLPSALLYVPWKPRSDSCASSGVAACTMLSCYTPCSPAGAHHSLWQVLPRGNSEHHLQPCQLHCAHRSRDTQGHGCVQPQEGDGCYHS